MVHSILGQHHHRIPFLLVNFRFLAGLAISMSLMLVTTIGWCAPTSMIKTTPMVQLQPGVREQRVTGMIKGKEWKQEIIGDVIYWKGILKTFYVYHSISGSSRACTKLGFVFLPRTKNDKGPVGYIDANCKKKDINPAAFVLIKQRDRPGDLTFDFQDNNVPTEGTATKLEAKHFKIEGLPLKSLRALGYPKSDSNHLYFYLNDVSEKPASDDDSKQPASASSTGDGTPDNFLPLQPKRVNEPPRRPVKTDALPSPREPATLRRIEKDPVSVDRPSKALLPPAIPGTNNQSELDSAWKSPSVMTDDFLVFQSRESKAQREAMLAQARFKAKLHLLVGRCRQTAQLLALNQMDAITKGGPPEALAERIDTISQSLEESMGQLRKDINQTISKLSERSEREVPPLLLVRQRAYIDLESISVDTEPVFDRLRRAMEQAACATYADESIASSSSPGVGTVASVPLAINQGGMVFCRDGKRVMRRLFATGLYAVRTTFEKGHPGTSKADADKVIEGNVRLLDNGTATEQLLLSDLAMPEGDNTGLRPCDQGGDGEWNDFLEADQQLMMMIIDHAPQQEACKKVYQQRTQWLQKMTGELKARREAWKNLGGQITLERNRLRQQLDGKYTGSNEPGSVTTAMLDDHNATLQQAIAETPFIVVIKFKATLKEIPATIDTAGQQQATSRLESMLDTLLGPDALNIAKGAKFIRQELTPVALVATGSDYLVLAKLSYRLKLRDTLPLCGDRDFLQRIGLIEIGATQEGYASLRDFRTSQEWLIVGMGKDNKGDKGNGFSLDDVDAFIDRRGGNWRLPKVEEIKALINSDSYQFMKRDIQAINRPFWTGSERNARRRGFCFSPFRQRNKTYMEQATEFADGDNLALLLLRSTTIGENQ